MITLYAFGRVYPGMACEGRDLRVQWALEETGQAKSTAFLLSNLKLGYRIDPRLQLTLDVLNLLNRKANDIEYWGGACTRNETLSGSCGGGIDGRLVHPLEPRTLRLSLRASF